MDRTGSRFLVIKEKEQGDYDPYLVRIKGEETESVVRKVEIFEPRPARRATATAAPIFILTSQQFLLAHFPIPDEYRSAYWGPGISRKPSRGRIYLR